MSENINTDPIPEDRERLERDDSKDNEPQPPPVIKDDLIKDLEIDSKVTTHNGPMVTIDVQPDFRNITLILIDHAVRIYGQIEQLRIPEITPPVILAYCLECIYTFMSLTDVYNVRLNTSAYANDMAKDPAFQQFMNAMSWRKIPPFTREMIKGMHSTFDPRRNNIGYILSFAAFYFPTDFYRTYPITMFLTLHDIICRNNRTMSATQIFTTWLTTPVIENDQQNVTVGNLLGTGIDNVHHDNYMVTKIRQLLSFMENQSQTRRNIFSEIGIVPYEYDTDILPLINPYKYLLGFNDENSDRVNTAMQLLSTQFDEIFPNSSSIGELFEIPSGILLMNHYYMGPALPTGDSIPRKNIKSPKKGNLTTYANKLQFKQTYRNSGRYRLLDPETEATPSTGRTVTDIGNILRVEKNIYLIDYPQVTEQETIKTQVYQKQDSLPDILWYSPYHTGISSMVHTLMNGIVIESAEIDGFKVPYPKTDTSIKDENSYILNSAIPISRVYEFDHLDGITQIRLYERANNDEDTTPISISRFDMSKTRFPHFTQRVTGDSSNWLDGFTPLHGITTPDLSSTKLSFKIDNVIHSSLTPKSCKPLWAWSSYRWINTNVKSSIPTNEKIFFLMNFRTVHGTNPLMIKARHPAKIIPI